MIISNINGTQTKRPKILKNAEIAGLLKIWDLIFGNSIKERTISLAGKDSFSPIAKEYLPKFSGLDTLIR